MTSLYSSEKGKRIFLYRNGDATFFGKPIVVHKRSIRNVDVLLTVATSHLNMPEQVREIRTPDQGRFVVKSLDDLVDDQAYVAVGNGRFKRMQYTALQDEHDRKIQLLKRRRERVMQLPSRRAALTPINFTNITSRGQAKEVLLVLVYVNGDEFSPAKKVVLRPRVLRNWNLILAEIDDVLKPNFGAVTRLYTLDGLPVTDQRDLKTGEFYVAAGRSFGFKKVSYGNQRKFILQYNVRQQPYDSLFLTESSAALHGETLTIGVSPRDASLSRLQDSHRDLTPDIEDSAPKLQYADGGEVFPTRATRFRRKKKKRRAGVFKARKEREEVAGAEVVTEERNISDIYEVDEAKTETALDSTDGEGLAYRYVVTPPPNPRPSGATGNRRLSRGARRSIPIPTPGYNKKVESGVGPSAPVETPRDKSSEQEANEEAYGRRGSGAYLERLPTDESIKGDPEAENPGRGYSNNNADSERLESDGRDGRQNGEGNEDKKKEEAARKIQHAFRAHRDHSDYEVRSEEQKRQHNGRQEQEQEDERNDFEATEKSSSPADQGQIEEGSLDGYIDDSPALHTVEQPRKQPNGQIKRGSIPQRRRV